MQTAPPNAKLDIPSSIIHILSAMGLSSQYKTVPSDQNQPGWKIYRFLKPDGADTLLPVLLVEHRAKNVSDAKKQISGIKHGIALFHLRAKYTIFFKSGERSAILGLEGDDSHEQVSAALSSAGFGTATSRIRARLAITKIIKNIPAVNCPIYGACPKLAPKVETQVSEIPSAEWKCMSNSEWECRSATSVSIPNSISVPRSGNQGAVVIPGQAPLMEQIHNLLSFLYHQYSPRMRRLPQQ